MCKMQKLALFRAATFALALTALLVAPAQAQITYQSPGATVAGKTIGEWTQDWWSWALSAPAPTDPLSDTNGDYANINQGGPVFFLGGTAGSSVIRNFTVPTGKYLLLSMVTTLGTDSDVPGGTGDDLITLVKSFIDPTDSLNATLDGVSIPEATLFTYRQDSGLFPIDVAPGSIFDYPGGVPGRAIIPFAYQDGFWLMLNPLSPGSHQIDFGGGQSAFNFTVSISDHVTAVPEPGVLAFGILATGSVVGLIIRRRHS